MIDMHEMTKTEMLRAYAKANGLNVEELKLSPQPDHREFIGVPVPIIELEPGEYKEIALTVQPSPFRRHTTELPRAKRTLKLAHVGANRDNSLIIYHAFLVGAAVLLSLAFWAGVGQ